MLNGLVLRGTVRQLQVSNTGVERLGVAVAHANTSQHDVEQKCASSHALRDYLWQYLFKCQRRLLPQRLSMLILVWGVLSAGTLPSAVPASPAVLLSPNKSSPKTLLRHRFGMLPQSELYAAYMASTRFITTSQSITLLLHTFRACFTRVLHSRSLITCLVASRMRKSHPWHTQLLIVA